MTCDVDAWKMLNTSVRPITCFAEMRAFFVAHTQVTFEGISSSK